MRREKKQKGLNHDYPLSSVERPACTVTNHVDVSCKFVVNGPGVVRPQGSNV
jgi:hypothetical protein